ncbi:hypothetical protein BX070DRAFT_228279 [Coemansia spiralis]|nr:hypothetical protein BX070DRAFT_228279 [Coemansia spiralis]
MTSIIKKELADSTSSKGIVGGAMKAISKETVHRLCSGQVIVDLPMAAKELLENSLDAGATHVDIKMKDSGLASITVTDNGHGISEKDFATLCRKHWTSKISSFEDLQCVATFGFRGEALSSLCAVASVTISTATSDSAPMGVQLDYDHNGELISQKPVARERGTTVQLTKLFEKWPVRQQDLKKNIRREYMRVVALVEQYAIICDKARIVMANQSPNGANTISVNTPQIGRSDRISRLAMVLGSQVRPHLVHFEYLPTDHDDVLSNERLDLKIDGYISKPIPEAGRSASDKQYFFVNGRPCDFLKAKKVVNEMYRTYCPAKYPVFAISISINANTVDVNLTPDKRTLLINHEARLLAALRETLAQVVEPKESVYSINKTQTQIALTQDGPTGQVVVKPTSVPGVVRCYATVEKEHLTSDNAEKAAGQKRQSAYLDESGISPLSFKQKLGEQPAYKPAPKAAPDTTTSTVHASSEEKAQRSAAQKPAAYKPSSSTTRPAKLSLPKRTFDVGLCRNRSQDDSHDWTAMRRRMKAKQERTAQLQEDSQKQERTAGNAQEADSTVESGGVGNASDPEQASSALSRLIHKSDFSRMEVIGQFNRGFIIARLDHDLYIIDQHASDEKYNFEQLQQRAVIFSQELINPARLELSIVDEDVAMEHKETTLMKNGFVINIDESAEPGRRISLLRQPIIDDTMFTQQDLLELLGKLCMNPESMPRCERARKKFASKACRKSIMIGDSLSTVQMKAVVRHLSELDHPWNCPHGRPTMRHLYRLPG